MDKFVLTVLAFVLLVGCASGSALVTGQKRPPIEDHTTITILIEMPEEAEPIAIVRASSNAGITKQKSLDYAVDELKRQAAKVGANTVVLINRQTESQVVGVPMSTGGTMISTHEKEVIEGLAVWID